MLEFVKMPSAWITNQSNPGLRELRWDKQENAGKIASLMLYIAIVHKANLAPTKEYPQPGFSKLSYSDFERIVGLSRAKISSGLRILERLNIVIIYKDYKTRVYQLRNYDSSRGWAKLPCQRFYSNTTHVFDEFHLRKKTELNALKMYLLIVAFRDNKKNHTIISYEKINFYTGISENEIRSALSLLVNLNLVQVDKYSNPKNPEEDWTMKSKNFYRLVGLKGRHLGNMSQDEVYLDE